MDPISFGITVASLISTFQTCLDGYQALNVALAMGDVAVGLDLRFRIEEMRLRLWGRNRGLPLDSGDKPDDDKDVQDKDNSRDQENNNANIESKTTAPLIRNNDVLGIPQIRRLVLEILGRISKLLEKQKEVISKYKALKSPEPLGIDHDNSNSMLSLSEVSKFKNMQKDRSKDVSKKTNFAAKIRWALKDNQALNELLEELTALNDGLENLLPRGEAISLSQSLTSEVINTERGLSIISEHSLRSIGRKAATTIELRQHNMTSFSEISSPLSPRSFANNDEHDHQIPIECFPGFTEPKLKHVKTFQEPFAGQKVLEVVTTRSLHYYTPTANPNKETSDQLTKALGETVLIEWRSQEAESQYSQISAQELGERRNHIVSLLHRTSKIDDDFLVLDCLGFTLTFGRLPNGEKHPLVGFVYRIPAHASTKGLPVSLREILGEAYASEETKIPDLDYRYLLAQKLAVSLYQLQCAGWIHRKISSYNIIFFKDESGGEVNLNQPYVSGWQYSRPDFRTSGYKYNQEHSEMSRMGSIGDLEMYVHPDRHNIEKGTPRFRMSYDIYSLGIVFIEIAFWEPIMAFATPDQQKEMESFDVRINPDNASWPSVIAKAAEKELGSEMGARYRNAVLCCIHGLKSANRENKYVEENDLKELEPGIESEFFWKVVNELKRVYLGLS